MTITDFGVAVIDGDRLSGDIERAGRLACADDWLQSFAPYIPTGGTVCDIGAALGDHTASYAAMVGATGRVHAVEPYAPFLECLRFNAVPLPNVCVHGEALGASEMMGTMVRSDVQPNNLGMTHLVQAPSGSVHVTTLDRLAESWDRLDFVKIDVEGSEPMVLDGAKETLTRFHPVLLIEINAWALQQKGFTPVDVYQRLRALGYTFTPARAGYTFASPEIDILCVPAVRRRHTDLSRPRVHLLSVPNTQTTDAYPLDGFCVRTRYFSRLLLRLGYDVFLYGVGDNDTPCTTFIQCMTTEEQRALIGQTPYASVPFDANTPLFGLFNKRAAFHLRSIKHEGDILATICGSGQQFVADHHPELRMVEYSIGYNGVAAWSHRVFQSHAWRHVVHGFTGVDSGRDFDAVIPPWFHVADFPWTDRPGDYVAYCGRLTAAKGLQTACDAAQDAGVPLLVMGHGDLSLVTYGTYVGEVSMEERNRLLSGARAVLMPTQYLEPFGNVSAEAQLCGTPVISTDFGGFTESVEHGVSGFRCTSLGEFSQAIDLALNLDRAAIRRRAQRLYSEDAAAVAYQGYFRRLETIGGDGWRSLDPGLETAALAMTPPPDTSVADVDAPLHLVTR